MSCCIQHQTFACSGEKPRRVSHGSTFADPIQCIHLLMNPVQSMSYSDASFINWTEPNWTLRCAVVLRPFPTIRAPKVHPAAVGTSTTLRCQPPPSNPPAIIHWAAVTDPHASPTIIEPSDRIALDDEGKRLQILISRLSIYVYLPRKHKNTMWQFNSFTG